MHEKSLVVFQDKKIRRIWHNEEWWFSVVDIVEVLTDSTDSKDYWYRLKKRELESGGIELSTFCRQLKLMASDGKYYETDCANTESIFRIIQSIPSPKAEPFKQWLAQVGYERVREIENPELAQTIVEDINNYTFSMSSTISLKTFICLFIYVFRYRMKEIYKANFVLP